MVMQAGDAAWNFLASFRWHRKRADNVVNTLRDMQILEDAIQDIKIELVADMRADKATWDEVGEALGISRQGARQRYGGAGIK